MFQFPSGPATELGDNHIAVSQQIDVKTDVRHGLTDVSGTA